MVLSMDRWVGKVAVVTGASAGIGAAIAEALVKEGLKVAGLARRKDRVEALANKLSGQKGKLYAVQADVSKEEDILNAFKWVKENLGPVHVLVNNAGIFRPGSLSDGDTESWRNVFEVNVLGLSIATREAVRDMKANKVDGHIIDINSVAGQQVNPLPGGSVYQASKFAARALAETLRLELMNSKSKIKITNLSPGAVDTEMTPDGLRALDTEKQIIRTEDIADAVIYALSTPPHVQVGGLARRKDRLEALADKLSGQKGKLYPVQTDMRKEEDILNAFKWIKENLGPVHILVNSAGVLLATSLTDGDTELWKNTLEVNVLGLCIATREAVKDMKRNNVDGHIIHVNSIVGHEVITPIINIYAASKFAVRALAETLRKELMNSKSKIKITNLSPGIVETDLVLDSLKKLTGDSQLLIPEDIVDAVLFALSTPTHVQIQELIIRGVDELYFSEMTKSNS